MINKLGFNLFFLVIFSLILIGISLFSFFNSSTESSLQWQAVCWVAYLIVFILFVRSCIMAFGYFDLRLAPLYSVVFFIIPRISALFFDMLQSGISVHPILQSRLVLTSSSFSVGLGLMLSGILLYITGSFGSCYVKAGNTLETREKARNDVDGIQLNPISPKVIILFSIICLAVHFIIMFYFFGANISNLVLSVVDPVSMREITSKITQSVFAIPFSLSVILSISAIFFAQKEYQKRIQSAVLFLAVLQSIAIIPLGNRQSVLFPILLWIIVTGMKKRKIPLWKTVAILVCILLFVVLIASFRYRSFRPNLNNFSPLNIMKSFTSELIMFDTFALIFPALLSGSIEYRLGGHLEDLKYFLPSFLLENPKSYPADYQLSLQLGIADYEPFGTPPTIFGGLLWNFGILGLILGSVFFGIIVYKLNMYLHDKMTFRQNSARSYLLYGVVFIFLMDVVRVGVFMREIVTLTIHIIIIIIVSIFIKLSMFKAEK